MIMNVLKGAVKGAVAGAMVGGPYGAVAGAIVGGAVGNEKINKMVDDATGKTAEQKKAKALAEAQKKLEAELASGKMPKAEYDEIQEQINQLKNRPVNSFMKDATKIGDAKEVEAAIINEIKNVAGVEVEVPTIASAQMSEEQLAQFQDKAVSLAQAARQQAAQIQASDAAKAAQLTQIADNMEAQLALSVRMDASSFADYLKAEAIEAGASPEIDLNSIITADASSYAQIGADAGQKQLLSQVAQAEAASLQPTMIQYEQEAVAAREAARQIGVTNLQQLAEKAQTGFTNDQELQVYNRATQQAQQQIASTVASNRGEYNPALVREAIRQQAAVGQEAVGQSSERILTEEQRRQEALAGIAASSQQLGLGETELAQRERMQQAQFQQQAGLQTSAQFQQAMLEQARLQQQGIQTAGSQQFDAASQQAQFQQQAQLANQQSANQFLLERARLEQQAAQGNQQAALQLSQMQGDYNQQMMLEQARMNQQQQLANQQIQSQYGQQALDFNQAALMQNLANQQAGYQTGAAYQQQANMANQQAYNQFMLEQAKLNQQQNQVNQSAQLQAQAQKIQNEQWAANQRGVMAQSRVDDALKATSIKAGISQGNQQNALMQQQLKNQQQGALIGAGSTIGAAAIMASDARVKEDIKPLDGKDLNEFFNAVKPQSYKYKEEKWGAGEYPGFMIQDIENTKIGQMITDELEDGTKVYNKDKLLGVLLAEAARKNKRRK